MLILTRRQLLKNAALVSAMGCIAPEFLTRTALGRDAQVKAERDASVLVVVQLSGGNDGLNTIVPYGDDNYHRVRNRIGLKQEQLLTINDQLAFNGQMKGAKSLYDAGQLAVVLGVGYPNPDRSHFRSMEIWHTASDSDKYEGRGWIGRYFDACCAGAAPYAGVAVGNERPQAFAGNSGIGVAFDHPDNFGWRPGRAGDTLAAFKTVNAGATRNVSLDFLRHCTSNAITSAEEVKAIAGNGNRGGRRGGGDPLARDLGVVADLISGGLPARIYYVSIGGFDTHANQVGQHDNLLGRVATALENFQQRLTEDKTAERVATMVFSEFGRRVEENASGGTDHGTAAPMLVVGAAVKPGLYGKQPSLTDLDRGDLKYGVDFRSVYASLLTGWLGVDAGKVLEKRFPSVPVVG